MKKSDRFALQDRTMKALLGTLDIMSFSLGKIGGVSIEKTRNICIDTLLMTLANVLENLVIKNNKTKEEAWNIMLKNLEIIKTVFFKDPEKTLSPEDFLRKILES